MRKLTQQMVAQFPPGQIIDCGPFYIDANGDKQPFVDEDGNPFIGLLDGKGHPLPEGHGLHILRFSL